MYIYKYNSILNCKGYIGKKEKSKIIIGMTFKPIIGGILLIYVY